LTNSSAKFGSILKVKPKSGPARLVLSITVSFFSGFLGGTAGAGGAGLSPVVDPRIRKE